MNILILNGPNLNLLGQREPELYGTMTLGKINANLSKLAKLNKVKIKTFQTNHEGELIDLIQTHKKWAHGILINPAAWTHYSIALRDVLLAVSLPTVEVHLSNLDSRESFRQVNVLDGVPIKKFQGEKDKSYYKGFKYLVFFLKDQRK